jgi:hypothetical protein
VIWLKQFGYGAGQHRGLSSNCDVVNSNTK